MSVILSKEIKVTGRYTGNSKFSFWKHMQIDDRLTLEISLDRCYGKPTVTVKNKRTGKEFCESMTVIGNYINKIKYESK